MILFGACQLFAVVCGWAGHHDFKVLVSALTILGFSSALIRPRYVLGSEAAVRYEVVQAHVIEHFPTDRLGVEKLVKLALLHTTNLLVQWTHALLVCFASLHRVLAIANPRAQRARDEVAEHRYLSLTVAHSLNAPPAR